MNMTPIPTVYCGVEFRSRLEARWSIFFSSLNVPWEYEREGYVLSDGTPYLPDFVLLDTETSVEIKPSIAMSQDMANKVTLFNGPMLVIFGSPQEYTAEYWRTEVAVNLTGKTTQYRMWSHVVFGRCRRCSALMLCGDNGEEFIIGKHTCVDHDRASNTHDENIQLAAEYAIKYRFDHRKETYAYPQSDEG